MKGIMYSVLCLLLLASCGTEEKSGQTVFVDSVQLFEGFNMKKEYDRMMEGDMQGEGLLLDSIKVLLNNERDSMRIFTLRKDYYVAEELFNSKFEQLSEKYTRIVMDRLNEYIREYATEHAYDMVVSGGNGSILYVNEQIDKTDELIEYVNKKFEQ